MKDITLLIAHPDDEALFLWPFLDRVKRIVCASNDVHNTERQWCRERGLCLNEVGKLLGCEVTQFPSNSEFYRLPTRDGTLHKIMSDIGDHLGGAEVIATHNAWGEYGHLDHILCHHIGRTVQAQTGCELLVTDISVMESPAWLPVKPWIQGDPWVRDKAGFQKFEIDRTMFDRIKAIYDRRGCWTWSFPAVDRCRVYSL